MLINYDEIQPQDIANFKGGEKSFHVQMFVDENNKIMKGKLIPGASIGLHRHEGNSEIIFITKGEGRVLYNGEYETVTAGSVHYCPMGQEHSLINDSEADLEFYAVVPEHNRK